MATMPMIETEALVSLTPSATAKLTGIMQEKQLVNHALRVFVAGGGCSGLQYGMTFDEDIYPGDAEFEVEGLMVRVDPMSAGYVKGANIDFQDSLMGGGFKIDNPNAATSCGCGSSFKPRGEESYEDAQATGGCASGSCGCGH